MDLKKTKQAIDEVAADAVKDSGKQAKDFISKTGLSFISLCLVIGALVFVVGVERKDNERLRQKISDCNGDCMEVLHANEARNARIIRQKDSIADAITATLLEAALKK